MKAMLFPAVLHQTYKKVQALGLDKLISHNNVCYSIFPSPNLSYKKRMMLVNYITLAITEWSRSSGNVPSRIAIAVSHSCFTVGISLPSALSI